MEKQNRIRVGKITGEITLFSKGMDDEDISDILLHLANRVKTDKFKKLLIDVNMYILLSDMKERGVIGAVGHSEGLDILDKILSEIHSESYKVA